MSVDLPAAVSPASGTMTDPAATAPVPPAVAAALVRLETLDTKPVAEHVEVYDAVHRHLQDALATIDEA